MIKLILSFILTIQMNFWLDIVPWHTVMSNTGEVAVRKNKHIL